MLPLSGARKSFKALVARYSNEPRAKPILEELLRVKAVRERPDGTLQAISRTYATVRWDPAGIASLGEQMNELCATLLHNLEHPAEPRLVRRIVNAQLDPRYRGMLVRDIQGQVNSLADSLDDALNHRGYTVVPKRGGPGGRVPGRRILSLRTAGDSRACRGGEIQAPGACGSRTAGEPRSVEEPKARTRTQREEAVAVNMLWVAREGPNDKRGMQRLRGLAAYERVHVRFLVFGKRARGHTLMKPTPSRPAERPLEGGIGNPREFLEPLAQILVHTGHSPQKLAQEFQEICSGLSEPPQAWNPAYLNFLTALPGVIARWHTDEQFLDSKGQPLPLPLKSESLSLASLIARVLPNEDPTVVVDSLIKFQGIRREGDSYLPTDRQLRFTEENAWVYGLRALLGMLRTIKYNVTRAGPKRHDPGACGGEPALSGARPGRLFIGG